MRCYSALPPRLLVLEHVCWDTWLYGDFNFKHDEPSFLSPCSIVLGILHSRHCSLLLRPHLQSSCHPVAGLRYVHIGDQSPWVSELVGLFNVLSYYYSDFIPHVNRKCLKDWSTGACAINICGSLNKYKKYCLFKPFP